MYVYVYTYIYLHIFTSFYICIANLNSPLKTLQKKSGRALPDTQHIYCRIMLLKSLTTRTTLPNNMIVSFHFEHSIVCRYMNEYLWMPFPPSPDSLSICTHTCVCV